MKIAFYVVIETTLQAYSAVKNTAQVGAMHRRSNNFVTCNCQNIELLNVNKLPYNRTTKTT